MSVHPILAALRKHKPSVVLIVLQIALTIAIVSNAIFIIARHVDRVSRPTGLTESNLAIVTQQWVNASASDDAANVAKLDSLELTDLRALRQMPGVVAATTINTLPLYQGGPSAKVSTQPPGRAGSPIAGHTASLYFMDANGLRTLGLKLVAGRNFKPVEVGHFFASESSKAPVVIITRQLADQLFPQGDALGQAMYIGKRGQPSTIIGVIARLQRAGLSHKSDGELWNSVLIPGRFDYLFSRYAVRTRPGRLDTVMHAIPLALHKAEPMQVISDDAVQSFRSIRAGAYQSDIGLAILMGVISIILIAVTAGGIVGLTSFWVGQRRKQIGVRRALGARRIDILRYFQIENMMIAGGGAVLGIVLAFVLNVVLMQYMAVARLPGYIVVAGVVLVLILGQLAVLVPARRAASISPALATRSV